MTPVDKRLLIKVATMYYIENQNQEEIAGRLGINRTTVSKYLKRAMQSGIIQISIVNDSFSELETALEAKFGLKESYVVANGASVEETKANLGKAALDLFKRIVQKNDTVGFAWGTSMGAFANAAAAEKCAELDVDMVPLVGGQESLDSDAHVNTIVYKVATAFKARSHCLYAPAITRTKEIREAIMQDSNYRKITELWDRVQIAVVGIGAPPDSSNLVWMGNFGEESIKTLQGAGAAGEICSVFYDVDGNVVHTDFDDRIIAVELERLPKLKYSVGIAASKEKIPAIYGALQGKFINALVTDEATAKILLEL